MVPITVATPRPDGAILHVVQYGQFLENIAKAYSISLQELLEKNYINLDTVIFPGDKLLIKPSTTVIAPEAANSTPTLVSSRTSEGAPTRTPTSQLKRPTQTPSPQNVTPVAVAAVLKPIDPGNNASSAVLVAPPEQIDEGPDYLLIVVFLLAVAGGGMITLGSVMKRAT
jgi:LysM repeat protein